MICPMKRLTAIILLSCAAVAGCSTSQPYVNSLRLERGLVIVLPGIEGSSRLNRAICRGLDEGGVQCAIETYDWTSFLGPLWNLRATARNHRQARRLADRIARYHLAYPGRPVFLVGQSGGGAIAVWTAETLPPEQKVDGIILLAASLSPNYMLDRAIDNSRMGVISFFSNRDWFLLATNVTGTMDGELTSSAGRTGFLYPAGTAMPRAYAHLHQVPWDHQMARAGYDGGHLTSGASGFIAKYVAPLLVLKEWNEKNIGAVMANGSSSGPHDAGPSGGASTSRHGGAHVPVPAPAIPPAASRPATRPGATPVRAAAGRQID
jgi:pimeloyl-ACP methyl ester carboxylesterase